jgi:hypothetical protein
MDYIKRLEKQNEELQKKLAKADSFKEKFVFMMDNINLRKQAIENKIEDVLDNEDESLRTYCQYVVECYESERDFIEGLQVNLGRLYGHV